MRGLRRSMGLRAALAMFAVSLLVTTTWAATEGKLHNFRFDGVDGLFPYGGLISDAAGNLYGTTSIGGNYACTSFGCGTAFELTPNGSGGWTETKLHNFGSYESDGSYPYGSLISDSAGNLYGVTLYGGDFGGGTAFELSPNGSGGWTEKKLHNFGNGSDGANPAASLIFDATGNLYGTTSGGGAYGVGTVFELSPTQGGGWTERKLHNFKNDGVDGAYPESSLIFDAPGNLYGTTEEGGNFNAGTVFELLPSQGGNWTEKKLHSFRNDGSDGIRPYAGLIFDPAGNLYGTTVYGGSYAGGTAFVLTPAGNGSWTERKLHNFGSSDSDGVNPYAGLILDGEGNLYGTTFAGGNYPCGDSACGTVFELSPAGGGGWTERKLHNFGSNGSDGANPYAGLVMDGDGNMYGVTGYGGSYGGGSAFRITP